MVPHILVIDDQISLPHFIAMELRTEGYQVSINCDDVSPYCIPELNPALIVLNWELRRTSGLNVYRQLRLVNQQIPIVVITAEDESSCCLALGLGVQTCLTKPFSMNDLLTAIDYHLNPKPQATKQPTHNTREANVKELLRYSK
ncbi:MAG: response regulator [Oculatellaceae cyanobacterium bins.114]|nr:response regulator [Oculatellaceae cyanobacterium bins.114]